MENRNGDLVSAQISVAGNVDFSGGNFRMDTPFCLKNDGEVAVGRTQEILYFIREIKETSSATALIWGY